MLQGFYIKENINNKEAMIDKFHDFHFLKLAFVSSSHMYLSTRVY